MPPITYTIDASRSLIRTTCTGATTAAEVFAHFDELAKDPNVPPHPDVLLDLRQMTSLPATPQMQEVAGAMSNVSDWRRIAMVTDRDALYGMTRMLSVFLENGSVEPQVFRDLSSAERWLSKREPSPR